MENNETTSQPKPQASDKERAIMIVKGEIEHWRYLEKGIGVNKEIVAKKIGALRFVIGQLEKLA